VGAGRGGYGCPWVGSRVAVGGGGGGVLVGFGVISASQVGLMNGCRCLRSSPNIKRNSKIVLF